MPAFAGMTGWGEWGFDRDARKAQINKSFCALFLKSAAYFFGCK
jgi:hypothetical protein